MNLIEPDYLPFAAAEPFEGPWLVFAPHPDDETYGMGGSIAAARARGVEIRIVIMTDGALGGEGEDLAARRADEAIRAVKVLGGCTVHFWNEPDRGLQPTPHLVVRAAREIEQFGSAGGDKTPVGTVFFPSLLEPHPDHRAAAVIVWQALRRTGFQMKPVSYDISVQSPCNALIDISATVGQKRRAMAVYASQESQRPYARRLLALNAARAWSLPPLTRFAESFFCWPVLDLDLWALLAHVHAKQQDGLRFAAAAIDSGNARPTSSGREACGEAAPDGSAHAVQGLTKLLVVLASDVVGGAEILTAAMIRGLLGRYRIRVLTQRAVADHFAKEFASGSEGAGAPLEISLFESLGLIRPFDYALPNVLEYAKAIRQETVSADAEVVYAVMHNASFYLSLAKWRFPFSFRSRAVLGSLHGSLQGYCQARGAELSWTERLALRLCLMTLRRVLAPSRGVADELIEVYHADPARVGAIYNGFDIENIRMLAQQPHAGEAFEAGTQCVVTSCRLSDQKDFETLIAAFARVRRDPEPVLIIIGDGPMRDHILDLARQHGVAQRVRMAGFLKNPFPLIQRCDVFVLSSHYEGFGNVLIEAMALGVPVVATDCPWGPSEILERGTHGRLVPPRDAAGLADVLQEMLDCPESARSIGLAGRHRAEAFSVARMAGEYDEAFQQALYRLPASAATGGAR